ncbi:UDP-glucose 4-epimerase GalE [Fodinicola acaciae]|uniref:UDP-glucose 4-epimerase GalE n=1 Tax=Fodinicola acaciae TaxID=2681555 RepID=UPI0013D1964D|nr:UDP-glucose 4-epimerase GalE [Fodinicola acaciae]
MTWLLTGGAGYIGSHVLHAMHQSGYNCVVLDDLSTGVAERVTDGTALVIGSVLDTALLESTIREHDIRGIVHLAGRKSAPDSVRQPIYYYNENVGGMISLLDAANRTDVRRIVLSSSAAVYGTTDVSPVPEDAECRPENPYGESKLQCEKILADASSAHDIGYVSLRYFNAAGAASPRLADRGADNLIPKVFLALGQNVRPKVFGDDWPTHDGTCVRDYVHVADLATAHVQAVDLLEQRLTRRTYNVGRGKGSTVLEVLDTIRTITGMAFDHDIVARRAGDPAEVVADVTRIHAELGWRAKFDLHEMISSAWSSWSPASA